MLFGSIIYETMVYQYNFEIEQKHANFWLWVQYPLTYNLFRAWKKCQFPCKQSQIYFEKAGFPSISYIFLYLNQKFSLQIKNFPAIKELVNLPLLSESDLYINILLPTDAKEGSLTSQTKSLDHNSLLKKFMTTSRPLV